MNARKVCVRRGVLGALFLLLMGWGIAAPVRAQAPAQAGAEAYTLPSLPYAYDAFEPILPAELLQLHHQKHHAAYVAGLNRTLKALEEARAQKDMSRVQALSRDLAFHGGGHLLHCLYWESMTPGGIPLAQGPLMSAIMRDFGSFDAFKAQFLAAARTVEANGWAVLVYEPVGGKLLILQVENHQNLLLPGAVPLLACDVWEHAYYLKYKNLRADYVDAFFALIDWEKVSVRYESALRGASHAQSVAQGSRLPGEVLNRTMERIDRYTLEAVTLTLREWMLLGEKDGMYKNPRTGKYAMVPVIVCSACASKIPMPVLPTGPDMDPIKHDELMAQYKCPKCGKPAMPRR